MILRFWVHTVKHLIRNLRLLRIRREQENATMSSLVLVKSMVFTVISLNTSLNAKIWSCGQRFSTRKKGRKNGTKVPVANLLIRLWNGLCQRAPLLMKYRVLSKPSWLLTYLENSLVFWNVLFFKVLTFPITRIYKISLFSLQSELTLLEFLCTLTNWIISMLKILPLFVFPRVTIFSRRDLVSTLNFPNRSILKTRKNRSSCRYLLSVFSLTS
mmetsp:Transcript_45477/g.50985  ORF Transcript_45477/g.50985 Transcript_45477/m.50985 type:complete len:214 (+) Transcript_45477:2852-3493(+)